MTGIGYRWCTSADPLNGGPAPRLDTPSGSRMPPFLLRIEAGAWRCFAKQANGMELLGFAT